MKNEGAPVLSNYIAFERRALPSFDIPTSIPYKVIKIPYLYVNVLKKKNPNEC